MTLDALNQLEELDRRVFSLIADASTPSVDEPLRRLSNAANYSRLWMGIAGCLALLGGRDGQRAAATGLVSIGVASALVNQGIKRLYSRERPDRDLKEVPERRHVRMPDSTSFPSGHSASAFAFATAVGAVIPTIRVPLGVLAAGVAYSRVHTGVHYPGDAIVGSLIGGGIGGAVAAVAQRRSEPT